MPKYGLKLSIFRVDEPDVELNVDLPEVGEEAFTNNPALASLRQSFESMTADLRKDGQGQCLQPSK